MPRRLRVEYAGAIYHVMNWGAAREYFPGRFGSGAVSGRFGEACDKTQWQEAQTTMTLSWIADRLHLGSWTYVSNLLLEKP